MCDELHRYNKKKKKQIKLGDKKLSEVYGVSKTDSKFTCYCHHFTAEGEHCVTKKIGSDQSKKCDGVFYAKVGAAIGNFFGVSSLSLACGKKKGGHRVCVLSHLNHHKGENRNRIKKNNNSRAMRPTARLLQRVRHVLTPCSTVAA